MHSAVDRAPEKRGIQPPIKCYGNFSIKYDSPHTILPALIDKLFLTPHLPSHLRVPPPHQPNDGTVCIVQCRTQISEKVWKAPSCGLG